jgi:hypothetical protein
MKCVVVWLPRDLRGSPFLYIYPTNTTPKKFKNSFLLTFNIFLLNYKILFINNAVKKPLCAALY